MDFGMVSVAAITVICYLLAQAVKAAGLDKKWLPALCGGFGAALGLLGLVWMPDFPAAEPLSALAVGIVSGLAATGAHQIGKQLRGKEQEEAASARE